MKGGEEGAEEPMRTCLIFFSSSLSFRQRYLFIIILKTVPRSKSDELSTPPSHFSSAWCSSAPPPGLFITA